MKRNWWRRTFFSRWELLEVMEYGKWYFGLELHKEHGFGLGSMYAKLGRLEDEGFLEREKVLQEIEIAVGESDDGEILWGKAFLERHRFRRTGKRRKVKDKAVSRMTHDRLVPQM